ncbi:MAG: Lrp/AsnC family transcriptional regulator [Rhodovulum sulfidophilum]|uniref:Lrp/AsnC family transcriptional regulator n=1 Tax=Rhodovulum sulfidophilum TaxID=35806 RepID=A0A2W5MZK8_RHOSU|nr:MAG: Lrp/AsnC family transcriptional regulator [Rhodovulum sulfidophilum]
MTRALDVLDRRVIDALGRNGRSSNRAIATELGVTEGTIRTRIKRLQGEGLIEFTVIKSFELVGSPNLVMMGIKAEPREVAALARKLSAIKALDCVMIMCGRYNLMVMGLFTSLDEVHRLVSKKIKVLTGIHDVTVSVAVHSLKYNARMSRILPPPSDASAEEE